MDYRYRCREKTDSRDSMVDNQDLETEIQNKESG